MSEKKCPSCGASIDLNAAECKYCGEAMAIQQQQYQAPQVPQYQAPQYQQPQAQQYQPPQYQQQVPPMYTPNGVPATSKSKTTAGILAILLGGIGAHKFYLGKVGLGILYLVFCWTYIPAILGLIEGIIYLTSSDEKFYYKYVKR
jgi:TM2 domain-containing membrane protein YozV